MPCQAGLARPHTAGLAGAELSIVFPYGLRASTETGPACGPLLEGHKRYEHLGAFNLLTNQENEVAGFKDILDHYAFKMYTDFIALVKISQDLLSTCGGKCL